MFKKNKQRKKGAKVRTCFSNISAFWLSKCMKIALIEQRKINNCNMGTGVFWAIRELPKIHLKLKESLFLFCGPLGKFSMWRKNHDKNADSGIKTMKTWFWLHHMIVPLKNVALSYHSLILAYIMEPEFLPWFSKKLSYSWKLSDSCINLKGVRDLNRLTTPRNTLSSDRACRTGKVRHT